MDPSQQEILDIFTRTRALLTGHFVLRSGLHSGHYFQCAQVCQHMDAVERLCELLLAKVRSAGWAFTTVLAPAMGGLIIGQEVARPGQGPGTSSAKSEANLLVLRRAGFAFAPGERVLVVEDVVTSGGARPRMPGHRPKRGRRRRRYRHAGRPKRQHRVRFDAPSVSLLELSFPTYPADAVPEALAKLPVTKPGS